MGNTLQLGQAIRTVWRVIFSLSLLCMASACASSGIELNSRVPAQVFKLELSGGDPKWKNLGQTPYTITEASTESALYRVSSEGRASQYLFFPGVVDSGQLELDFSELSLQNEPSQDKPAPAPKPKVSRKPDYGIFNKSTVLLLQAYAALWENKPKVAANLAEEAGKGKTRWVGPTLVQGLAAILDNEPEKARSLLTIARQKEPGTSQAIDTLLQTLP